MAFGVVLPFGKIAAVLSIGKVEVAPNIDEFGTFACSASVADVVVVAVMPRERVEMVIVGVVVVVREGVGVVVVIVVVLA